MRAVQDMRVGVGKTYGAPDTPQINRNNFLDFLKSMSVKFSIKSGEIFNQTTMRGKLERVW